MAPLLAAAAPAVKPAHVDHTSSSRSRSAARSWQLPGGSSAPAQQAGAPPRGAIPSPTNLRRWFPDKSACRRSFKTMLLLPMLLRTRAASEKGGASKEASLYRQNPAVFHEYVAVKMQVNKGCSESRR